MLKYSTYSVISPEGCASILWKDAEKAPLAAEAMAITSDRLHELRLCDRIVPEPLGGAHRDPEKMAGLLRSILVEELTRILNIPIADVLDQRYHRLMSIGRFDESELSRPTSCCRSSGG
jgi:acetyl-CoA carboxylase carboxyl transferase subunit alpha